MAGRRVRRDEVSPAVAAEICRRSDEHKLWDIGAHRMRAPAPRAIALLDGGQGARLLAIVSAISGFWELWGTRVPDRALPDGLNVVSCTCGTETRVEPGLVECEGACGRWFLRVSDAVLVKRFEDEPAAVAA